MTYPRNIIVGDVHGCLFELKQLVARVGVLPQDTWVFAGDLVEKGPDSLGVIRFVRTLAKMAKVVVVRGNHDDKALRRRSINRVYEGWTEMDWAVLSSSLHYYRLEPPYDDHLVVHGGIPTGLKELPTYEEIAAMSRSQRKHVDLLWITRYVNSETGKPVSLNDVDIRRDVFWAHRYDGRLGHVIFGHEPFNFTTPVEFKHATGIDLGCVQGNRLCALVSGRPVWLAVTVQATRAYTEWRSL